MIDTISVTIDDRTLTVPEGTLIVDAAKQAGIDIPVFCYHPKLPPVGMCRMCLVEVGTPAIDRASGQAQLGDDGEPIIRWFPALQTACTMPVSPGMVVHTQTERVKQARKDIIEFLLTSHPLDCPVCDKGGECPLQNQTMAHGLGESRFDYADKQHLPKHVPLGELIVLDRERCIQCGRCVRFQHEIAGDPVLAFGQRGRELEIITCSDPPFDSCFGGNTTDICPVGALTTVDFRFGARPWEMKRYSSICDHCAVGCNIALDTRVEGALGTWVIKRVMPRQNEAVNEIWICDKGRYGHHHARAADRLTTPLIRHEEQLVPATWDEALSLVTAQIQALAPPQVAGIAGDRLSNEDLFLFQALMRDVIHSPNIDAYPHAPGADLVAQFGVGRDSDWEDLGEDSAIVVVAGDVHEEAPIWYLRIKAAAQRGAQLVIISSRETKMDRYADHRLRIRYGSSPHLITGLTHLLLRDDAAHPGAEALRTNLTGFGPASTERLTGIPQAELADVAELLSAVDNLIILFGREGLNDFGARALAQAASNVLLATDHVGQANSGLLPLWPHNNTQGTIDMGVRPNAGPGYMPIVEHGREFESMLSAVGGGGIQMMWFAGADPVGDDASVAEQLSGLPFLVVQDLFLTDTAQLADVVLPAASFAEKDGTFTSGDRRVQWFDHALPPLGECRPDWEIFAEVGGRLGAPWSFASAASVLEAINASVPLYAEMTCQALRATGSQWPHVGNDSLYFGGTAEANRGGLGLRWPTQAEEGDDALGFGWSELPALHEGDLAAIPIRRLYQSGTLLDRSPTLDQRRVPDGAVFNPRDAGRLGLVEGMSIVANITQQSAELTAHLSAETPEGIVLVPSFLRLGPLSITIPKPNDASGRHTGSADGDPIND